MTYPIRPITEAEYPAYSSVLTEAFGWTPHPDQRARWQSGTEFDRTLAAFDGDLIVGVTGIYTFSMSVPGGTDLPVAGVTAVSVLPSHRRRGILSSLMRRQLADVHERGEPLAALYASESVIYGRYGYGRAADELYLSIPTHRADFVRHAPVDPALRIKVIAPADHRADFEALYDRVRAQRPGQYARNDHFWSAVLSDEEYSRHGSSDLRGVLAVDDSGVRGYALFRVKSNWTDGVAANEVQVNEVYAADPAAYALLWRNLLDRDLTVTVSAWGRPVDDPLTQLLADTRQLRARWGDELYVRVVDVEKALAARAYAAPVDVVIEVTDDLCPWNARRWRLTADASGAECKPTEEEADLTLPVVSLGAAYMGKDALQAQLGAGLLAEHTAGAVRQLATAMTWSPKPWAGFVF
ncbi:GNAT family N-acetyltransferase [Nonomuraea sp. NPDC050663]|uniref:GNAT family N-acetyltransferase n=1 Tax=Nonomuraea sp. NPDC050663 TaxID=3364370 RepID=UPI00379F43AC